MIQTIFFLLLILQLCVVVLIGAVKFNKLLSNAKKDNDTIFQLRRQNKDLVERVTLSEEQERKTFHQIGDMICTIAANMEVVDFAELQQNTPLIEDIGNRIKQLSLQKNGFPINKNRVCQINDKLSLMVEEKVVIDTSDENNLINLAETFFIPEWKQRILHKVNIY